MSSSVGRAAPPLASALALFLLVAVPVASCSDDVVVPSGGGQGGMGAGGEGGAPLGCDNCGGATPICVDDTCAEACPAGRDACHPATDPSAPDTCCESGTQCCTAAAYGYPTDLCQPAGTACPFACPDDVTFCMAGQVCQRASDADTYTCADSCRPENRCDGNVCCPVGSQCTAGECALADLSIHAERVGTSARLERRTFAANACVIQEGCVMAPGARTLLRFDLETPNTGDGDLFLGDPTANLDLFTYSPCHNHFHFDTYASYELQDGDGNVVATGHKQAFCLLDWRAYAPGAPTEPVYDCSFQGIQAGWSDVYGSELDCQWVDVTDVPPGDYKLKLSVNFARVLGESDFTNNEALVDVTIAPDSCPGGCRDYEATCCADGDPCGWGGDGSCDCMGIFNWDSADCVACLDCPAQTSCTGGCTPDTGVDCQFSNGRANNSVCDCGGNYAWDAADCGDCVSNDADCPSVNTCPGGCASGDNQPACCSSNNICGWENDGFCDCNGNFADSWDFVDCSSCACAP